MTVSKAATLESAPQQDATEHKRRYARPDQKAVSFLESRIVQRYVRELTQPGDCVLDLPCGYGRFVGPLREDGRRVIAADLSLPMLGLLREREGKGMPRLACNAGALPFRDHAFEAVVCVRLLQHVHNREQRLQILRELARVARHGVVATAYMECCVHRFLHGVRRLKRLSYYTSAALMTDAAAAGLRVARMDRPVPWLHAQHILQLLPDTPPAAATGPLNPCSTGARSTDSALASEGKG